MIVTAYNTKGGTGKTTSLMILLAGIAKYNAQNEDHISVKAFDTDPQGTLSRMFARRTEETGFDTLSITSEVVDLCTENKVTNEEAQRTFADAESTNDIVLIDCPGYFDADAVTSIFMSDIVLVPMALNMSEADLALPIVNQLNSAAKEYNYPMKAMLLLNRTSDFRFMSRSQKAILAMVEAQNYPRLALSIRRRDVTADMVNYGAFLHELKGQGSSTKSIQASLEQADELLKEISEISQQ